MKRTILECLITVSLIVLPILNWAPPAIADCPSDNSAKSQVLNSINNEDGGNCDGTGVQTTANAAVQVLSVVAGIAAVIMIIVAGFKYITSSGDTSKISSAKTTLVYALVGATIAVLAQVIIHFVLNQATGSAPGS